MPSKTESDIVKKPNLEENFSKKNFLDLVECVQDPIYFIENFVRIQHPMKGAVQFKLFDYQKDMISAFHNNKNTVVLTGRQLGKCFTSNINVLQDDIKVEIGSLIKLSFKEKIVDWIEKQITLLSK
jgi:hypothetical protein